MTAPNVAETVVDYLISQNVRCIFGVLAHTLFPFGDAIAKRPELRFINAQHEGGAGNMALGYARVTKQPAVCMVSAGGGATNIVTAVAQAYKEAVPLFVISSDIGTESFAKGHWASWHGMEHVRLFQPITKQSARLGRIEELGSVLDAMFRQTTRGRQGPVFFCIPEDLQETHLPEPITFAPSANPAAPAVDARTVAAAVDLLLGAKAPVVLAGTGVDWAQAQEEVQELAELLSMPVASSYTAKGVFPENHPLALGCLGNGGRMYARPFFQKADLVLAVGTSFSEGTTLGFGHKVMPENGRIVHIDTDPEQFGRIYPAELAIQADAKTALRAIIDGVKAKPAQSARPDNGKAVAQAKAQWLKGIDETIGKQNLGYVSVLRALNAQLTGKEILTTSGMTGDTLRNIDSKVPIVHAGEFRAIGTALATAYGVKIGRPDARVICITGDGSFMMEQQELATARYHNIPVMVLILRNNAYGGMRRDQQNNYGGRIIGTELFIPDLAKLADLYGAKCYSVTQQDQLTPVFKEALAKDELVIVDIKMD